MEHLLKRFEALIIDIIVVTLFVNLVDNILYIILTLLNISVTLAYYPYVVLIVVTMAYFTLFEAKTNKTIGKKITNLYVSDKDGYMSYQKAFIRNLTKLFWIPLIFDVLLGIILKRPSRLFDSFVGTDVYSKDELETV
ncbi:MAG: RDD family protein [Methanosphaera sp.]|nr:RDD family protein [Methanosphaera sp.]